MQILQSSLAKKGQKIQDYFSSSETLSEVENIMILLVNLGITEASLQSAGFTDFKFGPRLPFVSLEA